MDRKGDKSSLFFLELIKNIGSLFAVERPELIQNIIFEIVVQLNESIFDSLMHTQ